MIEKKQCSMLIVRLGIGGIGLFLTPLLFEIYFLKAYYVFCASVMFIGAVKHLVCVNRKTSFSQRWEKTRRKPYILNVIREGLPYSLLLVTSIFVLAVFGWGYTLAEFFELITPLILVQIHIILFVACLVSGISSYREKEKKFLANQQKTKSCAEKS